MQRRKAMRAATFGLILATVTSFAAQAVPVTMHYVNGTVVIDATLDVTDGQATSGSGTISGGGLIGTLPIDLLVPGTTLAPLQAVASNDCDPAASSCYDSGTFSCGCNFVANDTVFDMAQAIPVDTNGIAFQAGGAAINYGLSLYDAGDGTVGEIIVGDAAPQPDILNAGTSGGTLSFAAVPEPASASLFCLALAALRRTIRRPRTSGART
jgi:hypothetical protein